MLDFDPFDMDMDGDVDGIGFLGFDYLMRHLLGLDEDEDEEAREGRTMRSPASSKERIAQHNAARSYPFPASSTC